MKLTKITSNSGFTLLELLIAMAIFTTATLIVSDVFVRVNKAQRKTQGIQATASDARFAIESVVRSTRGAEIDYDYYGGSVNITGESVLALKTAAGTPLKFSRQNGSVCPNNSAQVYCLAVCLQDVCPNPADWEAVSPRDVNVSLLNFLIYPLSSPFVIDSATGHYLADIQPRVTIISKTENYTASEVEKKYFDIQTTVSTRVYKR